MWKSCEVRKVEGNSLERLSSGLKVTMMNGTLISEAIVISIVSNLGIDHGWSLHRHGTFEN